VTRDPTGLVTVRTAIVPIDSPRRYIRYAATAPATIVPQNNTLFITAPLHGTCFREACACHFRMQKAVWKRRGAGKCWTPVLRHGSQDRWCCLTHVVASSADNSYCGRSSQERKFFQIDRYRCATTAAIEDLRARGLMNLNQIRPYRRETTNFHLRGVVRADYYYARRDVTHED
jgi:hypothetical protein